LVTQRQMSGTRPPKPFHLVLTTVNVPELLHAYRDNLSCFGHLEEAKVWVVGDRKTPAAAAALCRDVTRSGLETTYLDVGAQEAWGRRFPQLYDRIPYDNESRRNIGSLHALEHGCRTLICIDDDNWPTGHDFIGGHSATGRSWTGRSMRSKTGFVNNCASLVVEPPRRIHPRGFPFGLRLTPEDGVARDCGDAMTVGVTEGLWVGAPDVDATTWLNGTVRSVEYTGAPLVVLDDGTWMPLNTQNTSVARELIPAFLSVPMGSPVPGGRIQRYGDVWGGYVLQAAIRGTAFRVGFGHPIVDHRRNPHDYLQDLREEFWGMLLTDWLVELLRNRYRPESVDIVTRVREIAALLGLALPDLPAWCPAEVSGFLADTSGTMLLWADACDTLRHA
jgi:hypothetical protein